MWTAAQQLVEALRAAGTDRVFAVPGESYLPLLDALTTAPDIELVTCRHESGAGLAAVADTKLTRRIGVACVSRGPGATNAALAVHTAEQDGAPLLLIVGQLPRQDLTRGVFQNVDYAQAFGGMAKRVIEVADPGQLAAAAVEAIELAIAGTPGPVVVSVPEDVFAEPVAATPLAPPAVVSTPPDPDDIRAVADRLAAAERPLLLVGGMARGRDGRRALAACAEGWQAPTVTSYKHQDLLDNRHPAYAGHLGFGLPPRAWEHLTAADLIVAVGTRLNEITTQRFRLPAAPVPAQPLVHVHPDREQIGRVFETTLAVVADTVPFLEALAAAAPDTPPAWQDWRDETHARFLELSRWVPADAPDGVDFGHIVAALADLLPDDAIVTMDAGNHGSWLHRHFLFRSSQELLGAISGAMGLGVPAALAAALRHPERQVVALVGDGGMLMTGNELATAVRHGARIRVLVANNGSYGTIRLHQEKLFPGRVAGTDLTNPDFAALGEAFGARGFTLDTPEAAREIIAAALAHDGPVVVDVRTSLEHLSAYSTLSSLANASRRS